MSAGSSVRPTVAIIGCGRIAGGYNDADDREPLTHVVAYGRAGARVLACCDRDPVVAEQFAKRWGVPAWDTNPAALLNRACPDIVSICTPPDTRLPIVAAVVRSSAHALLIEKPLASTFADAAEMASALRQWGCPVFVNYFRAFDSWYLRLEEELRAGACGRTLEVVARYYGAARTNASHLLERLLATFGTPATVRRLGGSVQAPLFQLAFENKTTALFLPAPGCSWAPLELDILCEAGRIRVIDSEQRAERFAVADDPRYHGFRTLVARAPRDADAPGAGGLATVVAAVVASVSDGRAPEGLLTRAVEVTRILDLVEA